MKDRQIKDAGGGVAVPPHATADVVDGDHPLYDAHGIRIDARRAVFNGVAYAVLNVTDVRVVTRQPPAGGAAALTAAGVISLAAVVVDVVAGSFNFSLQTLVTAIFVAGLCIPLGAWWLRSLKPLYFVGVTTSAGQHFRAQLPSMAAASGVAEALQAGMAAARTPAPAPRAPRGGSVLAQRVELARELFAEGKMTQEEYDRIRAELLRTD